MLKHPGDPGKNNVEENIRLYKSNTFIYLFVIYMHVFYIMSRKTLIKKFPRPSHALDGVGNMVMGVLDCVQNQEDNPNSNKAIFSTAFFSSQENPFDK